MNPVIKYFNGERLQCSVGVVISILSNAGALYFLLHLKKPYYNGMAYPFLVIPFLLLTICVAVVIRTPEDIARVEHMIQHAREKIKNEELPRMDGVMNTFTLLKRIEVIIAVIGVGLFFFTPIDSLWRGVGLGLAIQSLLMFAFDIVAANRGKEYWEFLKGFSL